MERSTPGPARVDLLVIGAGAAGMTAGAYAARASARVLVVEKASAIGGSAAISGGFVWTASALADVLAEDPRADASLAGALVDGFPQAITWLRSLGLSLSDEITGIYGFGRGYRIEPVVYLDRCRSEIESAGGRVVVEAHVEELRSEGDRVVGADARAAGDDRWRIDARWTLLATGGFQADPVLRAAFIHRGAGQMPLRAAPSSTGDGLRLGLAAGAELTADMAGFYGHLVPSPLASFPPQSFIPFAQLHSAYCLLLGEDGARFTDESLGDHRNVQAVLALPEAKAILVADGEVHRTRVLAEYIPGLPRIDRFQVASDAGARIATTQTFGELAEAVAGWGVDGAGCLRTLTQYNELARADRGRLHPSRTRHAAPLETPPYVALEVQPAITFTYGGLRADASCRALRRDGPIPGLLVAGVDMGGVYHRGYAGGLARAVVFGIRAAQTATSG